MIEAGKSDASLAYMALLSSHQSFSLLSDVSPPPPILRRNHPPVEDLATTTTATTFYFVKDVFYHLRTHTNISIYMNMKYYLVYFDG